MSEVVALTLADLSSGLERLRIMGSKGGDRVVPLSDANRARLTDWLAVRATAVPGSPFVFPQLRSTAYRRAAARSGVKVRGSGLSTAYVRAMTAAPRPDGRCRPAHQSPRFPPYRRDRPWSRRSTRWPRSRPSSGTAAS